MVFSLAHTFISTPIKILHHLDIIIIENTSKNNNQYILKMSSFNTYTREIGIFNL